MINQLKMLFSQKNMGSDLKMAQPVLSPPFVVLEDTVNIHLEAEGSLVGGHSVLGIGHFHISVGVTPWLLQIFLTLYIWLVKYILEIYSQAVKIGRMYFLYCRHIIKQQKFPVEHKQGPIRHKQWHIKTV